MTVDYERANVSEALKRYREAVKRADDATAVATAATTEATRLERIAAEARTEVWRLGDELLEEVRMPWLEEARKPWLPNWNGDSHG